MTSHVRVNNHDNHFCLVRGTLAPELNQSHQSLHCATASGTGEYTKMMMMLHNVGTRRHGSILASNDKGEESSMRTLTPMGY